MSSTQGILTVEDTPPVVRKFFEKKYVDLFGESRDFVCLSWYEGQDEFRALFEGYENAIDVKINIDVFFKQVKEILDEQTDRRAQEHPDLQGG